MIMRQLFPLLLFNALSIVSVAQTPPDRFEQTPDDTYWYRLMDTRNQEQTYVDMVTQCQGAGGWVALVFGGSRRLQHEVKRQLGG